MNCPSFIVDEPSAEDYIFNSGLEAAGWEEDELNDDLDEEDDVDFDSPCDCELCRGESWVYGSGEQTGDPSMHEQELEEQVHNLIAGQRSLEAQAAEYRAKITDRDRALSVTLDYAAEIKRLQDQLMVSQHNAHAANNRAFDAGRQAVQLEERLKLQLESDKNYLTENWAFPNQWWKGFDLYLFGSWISLRKTPDGWRWKSGSRPTTEM